MALTLIYSQKKFNAMRYKYLLPINDSIDTDKKMLAAFDFDDSVTVDRLKQAVLKSVLIFYKSHTARETCETFGIPFTAEYVKILHRLSPKGLGLGGARKGSGQKKRLINNYNQQPCSEN